MSHHIKIITLALALLPLAACVDAPEVEQIDEQTQTRQQSVVVVPEFTISGTEAMPEPLYITKLGFTISEIRLTPLAGPAGQLSYSAANAKHIEFDVARGQIVRYGEPLTLPRGGRYLISLRLEPIEKRERGSQPTLIPSFTMSGFVSNERVMTSTGGEDGTEGGDVSEGPLPDPFDEKNKGNSTGMSDYAEEPEGWTPFFYHSERAVFLPMNEVDLKPGPQLLNFNFNAETWAFDLVEPISRAIAHPRRFVIDGNSVDVSPHVESTGRGAEALLGAGEASVLPRR